MSREKHKKKFHGFGFSVLSSMNSKKSMIFESVENGKNIRIQNQIFFIPFSGFVSRIKNRIRIESESSQDSVRIHD